MKTRAMQANDIAQVIAIEQAANPFPWSQQHFQDCLTATYPAWVFSQDNGNIIAFAIAQHVVDEIHLLNICVQPEWQNQGWGSQVLQHVLDYAIECAAVLIVLEVRQSNQRAQQLYLRFGFNEIAVRKDYYPGKQGREDAILMGRDLSFTGLFNDDSKQ